MVAVRRVDRGQDVPLDAVCLEDVEAADHPVVGGLSALVDSVPIVELPGPVDGDSDQELVVRQELPPLVVEESAVRLQGVADRLARLGIRGLQFHGEPEEVESHHRGLPALPRHDDLRSARLALDELANVGLEQVSGHAEPATGVEHLLGKEEAVLAVEVAGRTCRLRHHMKRLRSLRHREHGWCRTSLRLRHGGLLCCRLPRGGGHWRMRSISVSDRLPGRGRRFPARTCPGAYGPAGDDRCYARTPRPAPWPMAPPTLGTGR